MKVAVKYCGGCNCTYNRTGLLHKLQEAVPGTEWLPHNAPEANFDLVLCGCAAACARFETAGRPGFVLTDAGQFAQCCTALRQAAAQL